MIQDNYEHRPLDKKRDNMSSEALIRREKCRKRIEAMREARSLGMTIEEYMEVVGL